MLRTLLLKVCALLTLLAAYSTCLAFSPYEKSAREWCDSNPLTGVEGIWEYPEDGARVLIRKDNAKTGTFTISIISTADCRLEPGDVIGHLYPTIDNRQFRLEQMTRKDKLSLINPFNCTATLSADGESLRVKSPKLKYKVNLHTLLPRFWRLVRITVSNPADDLPVGLIKIYPGYDHNGSMRRKIRVL